jgi:hypothetical protein
MNTFPNSRQFAFAIFDDTDLSTAENIGAITGSWMTCTCTQPNECRRWPALKMGGRGASLQDPAREILKAASTEHAQ